MSVIENSSIITTENLQYCCRICLDADSDHILIDQNIQLHMKSCLAITVTPNDEFPKTICVSCMSQLNEFYHFQLNAHCSQDWLASSIKEANRKSPEVKSLVQPLPDSEYNSDSLLEFLNNTTNIDDYLNNLGKDDIPSIVSMLDRNNEASEGKTKLSKMNNNMEIDVLDSDIEIVQEILMKETDTKAKQKKIERSNFMCTPCNSNFDSLQELSQHLGICDRASRTCKKCGALFNSKFILKEHYITTHITSLPVVCECTEDLHTIDDVVKHYKTCDRDFTVISSCYKYKCKECGKSFYNRFQMYKHAKNHVMEKEKRICDVCGHMLQGDEALAMHKKQEHNMDNSVMYKCKICGLTLMDHKDMYMHVKGHTMKSTPQRHLCEQCGRSCVSRASLLRHMVIHSNNKPHKCPICKDEFSNPKEREEHKKTHDNATTVICERCGQAVNGHLLNRHTCV